MRKKSIFILNILTVVCTLAGMVMMFLGTGKDGLLVTNGFENLRYYTVLSNLFSGGVAVAYLITRSDRKALLLWKYMSSTCVALTFLMIALFFGPLYGWLNLYHGSNFMFHLVVPVLAVVELFLMEGELTFKMSVQSAIPTFLYGTGYFVNLLINGIGQWPDTNDWYGFVNWGWGVAIGIFFGVILSSWGIACLLRWTRQKVTTRK